MELEIEELRKLCKDDKMEWTLHSIKRIRERGITVNDIFQCVMNGEIIEQYPNDKPFQSCLIYAVVRLKNIHIVIASDKEKLYLVTAYHPSNDKWENDFKTRKENK